MISFLLIDTTATNYSVKRQGMGMTSLCTYRTCFSPRFLSCFVLVLCLLGLGYDQKFSCA